MTCLYSFCRGWEVGRRLVSLGAVLLNEFSFGSPMSCLFLKFSLRPTVSVSFSK